MTKYNNPVLIQVTMIQPFPNSCPSHLSLHLSVYIHPNHFYPQSCVILSLPPSFSLSFSPTCFSCAFSFFLLFILIFLFCLCLHSLPVETADLIILISVSMDLFFKIKLSVIMQYLSFSDLLHLT